MRAAKVQPPGMPSSVRTEVPRSWMLNDSRSLMFIRGAGCAMARETKFLRKQADKASEGRA
jgi:hypothetical protein